MVNELNDLLREIEARYRRTVVFGECHIKDGSVHADIFVDEAKTDNVALVKALRHAVKEIEHISCCVPETLAELASILKGNTP